MSTPALPRRIEVPLRGPEGLRVLTRLALSQALRELVEVSLAMIPTFGEEGLEQGAYSSYARRVVTMTRRVRVLAALNDRLVLGSDWETLDRNLGWVAGRAERMFGEMEQRWRDGDPAPWSPVFDAAARDTMYGAEAAAYYPLDVSDPSGLMEELDRFCFAHVRPDPHDRGPKYQRRRQVSDGLPY